MGKPWEFEPKRGAELQAAATFRRRAAVSAFSRLAGRSLRERGIDPSILTPSRGLEDNEPGTENERFERTVQRLTGMGMEPGEAVKQVRRFLDVTSRRTGAGMVRPKPTVQPGLDAVRQGVDQPPVPYRTRYDEKTEAAIQQFRTDLTAEGYEPWMIDTQLRGQIRLGALMEEIQANFPSRTPPGTTIESLALDRLDKEMGDLLRKATPQGRKKGPIESFLADTLTGGLLKGLSIGLAELEKDPMLGGPFARTGQVPAFDPEGETGFERGAEISRPVVQRGQEIVGEPYEQVGKAGIPVVSPAAREISEGIRSQIVEDIGTEIINPAALVLVAPIIMQGTQGLRGVRLAAQMTSNLLGTGLEPALARGTLRGLTILGRDGLAGLSKLSRAVRKTPIIQEVLRGFREAGEAGGRPGKVTVELPGDVIPKPRKHVPTPMERNILQAHKPRKPVATPALKPFERDQAGAALERLSEAPDNPVSVRSRRDLPELSQYDDQLEAVLQFRDDARDTLKFNRSAVKAGILSPSRISEATSQLVRANEQLKAGRAIFNEAKIRAVRDSVMGLVHSVGGSEPVAGIIGRAFDASVRRVPLTESLLTASSWRQHIAQGVALVKGRVFRGIGLLADQKFTLVDALHLQTADEANDLFRLMRKTLEKESDGLTFIGPSKYADLAEGEYRLHHIVQHPEWFTGKTPKLDGLLIDAQLMMRGRLEQARALGYPIEALDGAYLEQLWDIPRAALEQPILRARGKISTAKQRWFDDYFEGLSKGGKPLDLTVEELMQHSSSLLDEAIGDAWMRQEVLRRYGTRSAKVPALKGARRFGNPLYQGWSAPQDVTSAIDRLYSPVGTGFRAVGDVAATMKNTAFGLVDIAVGGVQFPLALAHGGREIAIGTLNRSLEALGLPYVHVALQDVNVVGRNVQYAEDGLHIGIGPSSVRLKSGTIVKYIPIAGKYIDMPLSKTIDFSARMQFGQALTAIRRRMYEGNLISAKFVGQDITDPKVRQFWSEAANAGTGASRGAQTPGRRGLETFVLTSAPMTRANLAVYAQIAEGLTTGGRMQKLRTAMVLANLATYTYGMQYLINGVFGDGPMEWQPGKPDWATIRIKGETIPLMPQRTLARAIDKSITVITEGIEGEGWRPEDIALAWAQVMIGKSSPAVQAMLAPFGVGFEPDTGRFHMGGLSPKGRALGVPPTPPLAEQIAFQETDVLSLVLAGVGFNPYPTSPNRLLQEEWKETTGQDFNPEVDWIVADSHPELSAEFSPLVAASNASSLKWGSLSALRRDRIEQFRGEKEVSSGLEKTAEEFIGGGDVGVVFIGEWLDHQAEMSAVISFNLFGDDRQAETPEGKALQAWGEVQPHDEKYRDPITRDVDRDAYRTDKEAAFAAIRKIYPELADSLEARIRAVSPNLVKVEPDIITALDALSGYREIDRWFGIDKAMENKVEDIHALVDAKRDELALQGFLDVGSGTVYTILADERPDISQNVWEAAWIVRPGADSNYRNPEADRYLIDHEPELRRFFPGLYRRGLLAVIGTGASGGTRRLSPALQARLGGK